MVGTPKRLDPGILEAISKQIASLKDSVLQEILKALAGLGDMELTNVPATDMIEDIPIFIPSSISKDYDTDISIEENESKDDVSDVAEALRKAKRNKKAGGSDG